MLKLAGSGMEKKWKRTARVSLPEALKKQAGYIMDLAADDSGDLIFLVKHYPDNNFLMKLSHDNSSAHTVWAVNAKSLELPGGDGERHICSLNVDRQGNIYSGIIACDHISPARIGILKLSGDGKESDFHDGLENSSRVGETALHEYRINSRDELVYLTFVPEPVIGIYSLFSRSKRLARCSRLEHYMKKMSRSCLEIDENDNIYVAVNDPAPVILKYDPDGKLMMEKKLKRIWKGRPPEMPCSTSSNKKPKYEVIHICSCEIEDIVYDRSLASILVLRHGCIDILSKENFDAERITLKKSCAFRCNIMRIDQHGKLYRLDKYRSFFDVPVFQVFSSFVNPRITIYESSVIKPSERQEVIGI
ncbi:MAG: hypothetical protein AB2L14_08705 [Candidatus Xenobiia bacterium LiM19]